MKEKLKMGTYVCVVREGTAFFNKRSYSYGDKIVIDSEELLVKMDSCPGRFVTEAEFDKADGDVIRKVVSASRNNKTVEDIIRSTDEDKKKMKAEYEAKLAELSAQIKATETKVAEPKK